MYVGNDDDTIVLACRQWRLRRWPGESEREGTFLFR
jgi:hypothetical protein